MMSKPPIHDQAELLPFYDRYREQLCHEDALLAGRLCGGALERVDFMELIGRFAVILLDAFGVLNMGAVAIAGAATTLARLQQRGHMVLVVSNNASQSPQQLAEQLRQLGFDLEPDRIICSGMAVREFVRQSPWHEQPYYLVGTPASAASYAPHPERLMVNAPSAPLMAWQHAKYILLCSNRDYYGSQQQQQVEQLLTRESLPILLANPDVAVPTPAGGLQAVAGYTAAQLAQRFGSTIVGIGKPFAPPFVMARRRFPDVAAEQFLLVGDTLDTDILGGTAQGFTTCLALSGGTATANLDAWCRLRGICPDFVVTSIAT